MSPGSTHCVIYVPGLGDGYDSGRKFALMIWRLYGVKVEFVPMKWATEKAYTPKYTRVVAAVKRATQAGQTVTLVGDSAGASMILNVFADMPDTIQRVITICGVDSAHAEISPLLKQKVPALNDSVKHLTRSIPKLAVGRIVCFQSRHDRVVDQKYSSLKGATTVQLPVTGHNFAISYCLTVGAPTLMRWIKRP